MGIKKCWVLTSVLVPCAFAYTLNGTVQSEDGMPLKGVNVMLVKENKTTQTDDRGQFILHEDEIAIVDTTVNDTTAKDTTEPTTISKGILSSKRLSADSKVVAFDALGHRIHKNSAPSYGVLYLKNSLNGKSILTRGQSSRALAKEASKGEFLRFEIEGFEPINIPIANLDTTVNVKLKTLVPPEQQYAFGYALKNAPRKSKGCGKKNPFPSIFHYTGGGVKHEVRINVPTDYDPNKPYRLIFGMHCMGGSAQNTVDNEQYYRLITLDKEHTSIFVAPHGYTDGAPWRVRDDKDHRFFDELLTHLFDNLCIDTTRVFSTGFSFGAMFTNSLAQDFQHRLRAVAVYATADINIYLPQNKGKPIAWMGTVGMSDGMCTPKLGRSARDRILKNNGINGSDARGEKATEYSGSGNHVCYDYKTVDPRFPVKWCTFKGSHEWEPKDSGSKSSWVPQTTWEFFNQF